MVFFTLDEVINAKIIKAHTVDQTFGIYQTKRRGLSLPGCGRGYGTDLDRSKSPLRLRQL